MDQEDLAEQCSECRGVGGYCNNGQAGMAGVVTDICPTCQKTRARNEENDWVKYVHNLQDKTEIEEHLDQKDLARQCDEWKPSQSLVRWTTVTLLALVLWTLILWLT